MGKEKEIRKKIDWSNKKEVNQALILDRMLLSEAPDEIKDDKECVMAELEREGMDGVAGDNLFSLLQTYLRHSKKGV